MSKSSSTKVVVVVFLVVVLAVVMDITFVDIVGSKLLLCVSGLICTTASAKFV